jgi:hypothetical protein
MRLKIVLLVSVLFLTMTSSVVFAHGSEQGGGDQHARVGELASFEGKLETAGQEKGPYEVQFHAIRLEDNAKILSMKSSSNDGSYKFAMQFFDGAEHEVAITLIDPDTKSVLAEKKVTVEVEGFHPPFAVKVKTTVFLLFIIAFGMVVGVGVTRWGKSIRKGKGEHPHVA